MRTPTSLLVLATLPVVAACGVEEGAHVGSDVPGASEIKCINEAPAEAAYVESDDEDCAYFVTFGEGGADGLPGALLAETGPRTVYLNQDGGTFAPGRNNSSANVSSLVQGDTAIPPFPGSQQSWNEVVQCVRERFARFDLEVTEDDPGERPHLEAVVGGHPCQLGLGGRVRGVAPLANDCSVVEQAVVYSFAHNFDPNDVTTTCEVTAHEIGHALGLDHEYLCDDPMTYLSCGHRSFQDVDAECGTTEPRTCACGPRQNSAQHLYGVLGPSQDSDAEPPSVEVLSPDADQELLGEGDVVIEARAWDDDDVAAVKLLWHHDEVHTVDCERPTGGVECSRDGESYRFVVRAGTGTRSFSVQAVDRAGNSSSTSLQRLVLRRDDDGPSGPPLVPVASEGEL